MFGTSLRRSVLPAVAASLTAAAWVASNAFADSPAEFYKGRRIELLVGSESGDGYDTYARLLTRHLGRHIPGEPSFIVKNMPGGGGRPAVNHIYSILPRDGSAFGASLRNIPFDPLYGVDAVKIDATKLGWIGSLNSEVSLCVVWHDKGVRTIEDARAKQLLMGSNGPSISDSIHARLLNRLAGTKLKVVLGYPSSNAVHVALERGEVEGRCGLTYDSLISRYAHWVKEKKVVILAQFAAAKHPDLPDVPFILDYAKTEADRQIVDLLLAPNEMGRPYFAPPGIPADRLETLRRGFDAAAKDPQLIAEATKQNLAVRPMSGEAIATMVQRVYATPRPVVEIAKKIVDPD